MSLIRKIFEKGKVDGSRSWQVVILLQFQSKMHLYQGRNMLVRKMKRHSASPIILDCHSKPCWSIEAVQHTTEQFKLTRDIVKTREAAAASKISTHSAIR